ncbi:cilia- and flagella-associated protein 20-like [Cydia splendana]|uniref:cilia- and flagella-associated protein 20-like n=1 Tax=Cydia splendana TaxID=1100963 RepID=UPI00300D2D91
MFRTSYQRGFLTVFYSCGSKPLDLWEVHMQNGHIARLMDPDIKSMVVDIRGTNVSTAYITCPTNNRTLGITMPFMIMVVKNLKKYFTFEVTILDEGGVRRRFRVSNFQSTTQILPMSTAMPISLADGWNQIQFNLSEFTRRAYNKSFVEVQNIKVNANIRLRRIYFADRLTPDEDLPAEYRIFLPLPSKVGRYKKAEEGSKITVIKPAPSKPIVTSQTKLKTTSQVSIVQLPPAVPPEAGPVEGGEPPETVQAEVTPEPVAEEVEAPAQEGEAAPEEVEAPVEESAPTEGEAAAEAEEVQPESAAEVQHELATEVQPEAAAEAQP